MTVATIKKVNAAIADKGVELVKGNGYFYFADTGEDYVADFIDSVYSTTLRCMTVEEWVAHVS
tara:strand:- start:1679 stop:1867 length:189 start_codon:yes stop_codon:yes gene_type:complete